MMCFEAYKLTRMYYTRMLENLETFNAILPVMYRILVQFILKCLSLEYMQISSQISIKLCSKFKGFDFLNQSNRF